MTKILSVTTAALYYVSKRQDGFVLVPELIVVCPNVVMAWFEEMKVAMTAIVLVVMAAAEFVE